MANDFAAYQAALNDTTARDADTADTFGDFEVTLTLTMPEAKMLTHALFAAWIATFSGDYDARRGRGSARRDIWDDLRKRIDAATDNAFSAELARRYPLAQAA